MDNNKDTTIKAKRMPVGYSISSSLDSACESLREPFSFSIVESSVVLFDSLSRDISGVGDELLSVSFSAANVPIAELESITSKAV